MANNTKWWSCNNTWGPTHQDAFIHVAVAVAQVHAHPDYTRVGHLAVVHRQGGHGHGALVVGGQDGLLPSTAAGRQWSAEVRPAVRAGAGRSRRVWRGIRGGAGGGRGRGGRWGGEGLGHVVARAVKRLRGGWHEEQEKEYWWVPLELRLQRIVLCFREQVSNALWELYSSSAEDLLNWIPLVEGLSQFRWLSEEDPLWGGDYVSFPRFLKPFSVLYLVLQMLQGVSDCLKNRTTVCEV